MKKAITLIAIIGLFSTSAYSQYFNRRASLSISAVNLGGSSISATDKNYSYLIEENGGTGFSFEYGFALSEEKNIFLIPKIDFNTLSVYAATTVLDSTNNTTYGNQNIEMLGIGLALEKVIPFSDRTDFEIGITAKFNSITSRVDTGSTSTDVYKGIPTKTALSTQFYSPIVFGAKFGLDYFFDEFDKFGIHIGYSVNLLTPNGQEAKKVFIHSAAIGIAYRL